MPLRPACMFHRTFREYSEAGLTCIGIIGFIINRLCIFFFFTRFLEVSEFKFFVYVVFDGCGNIGIIIRLISIPEIQKCHCDRPACSIARLESTVRQDSWQQWHPLGGTKELRASAAGILNAWLASWNDQGYLERVTQRLDRVSWKKRTSSHPLGENYS